MPDGDGDGDGSQKQGAAAGKKPRNNKKQPSLGTRAKAFTEKLSHEMHDSWDSVWRDPDENTGLSRGIGSVTRAAGGIERYSRQGSAMANQAADTLDKTADNWGDYLKSIADSSSRTANASEKTKDSNDRIAKELGYAMIGRISAYIAEDAALANLR